MNVSALLCLIYESSIISSWELINIQSNNNIVQIIDILNKFIRQKSNFKILSFFLNLEYGFFVYFPNFE